MENTDFQRIKKIMEIKQIPTFAEFARILNLPNQQYFTDIKRQKHKITTNFARKITSVYNDISTLWVLTGEGGIFVDNRGNFEGNTAGGDILGNGASKTVDSERLLAVVESQQDTIRQQSQQISVLISMINK